MSLRELMHWGRPKEKEEVQAVSNLRTRMDQLFDSFFTDRDFPEFSLLKDNPLKDFSPSMDISENDTHYTINAELPGLDKGDIKLEVDGDYLVVSGEKKEEADSEKDKVYVRECSYGSFKRLFRLPENLQTEDIKADFNKGVLHINIPKGPETGGQTKKIEIA